MEYIVEDGIAKEVPPKVPIDWKVKRAERSVLVAGVADLNYQIEAIDTLISDMEAEGINTSGEIIEGE